MTIETTKKHLIETEDDIIETIGKTSELIEKINKLNETNKQLIFISLSCNVVRNKQKHSYSYYFTSPIKPSKTFKIRSRDTKHAVNVGNSVWDSPYHIPLGV